MRRLPTIPLALVALLAFLAFTTSARAAPADPPRRLAILSDSTGVGTTDGPRLNSFPTQLGRMLGAQWQVVGFARLGLCVDPRSQRFALSSPEWKFLSEFNPDVVVVALGATDCLDAAFGVRERLDEGLDTIVSSVRALPKGPQVIVCEPPPPAPEWHRAAIYALNVKRFVEALEKLKERKNVTVVATLEALTKDPPLVAGTSVPTVAGATAFAGAVFRAMIGADPPPGVGPYRNAPPTRPLRMIEAIRDGVARATHGHERWTSIDGALEASGTGHVLTMPLDCGAGEFRIRCTLRIADGSAQGPGLGLDSNWIQLGDSARRVLAEGAFFWGQLQAGPASDIVPRDKWFELEIRRVGGDLSLLIDDRLIIAEPCVPVQIQRFAFDPQASTTRVRNITIETEPQVERLNVGLPFVDLAYRADLRVVVDRDFGQYLGHPATVLLEDGATILCVYPKGHGRGAIVLRRSNDGGRTWSEPLAVPENWATSLETPTIHRLVDPRSGARRLVVFSGLYPLRRAVSDDDGATWTPLESVGDWGGIVAMSSVITAHDGTALGFFHDDGRFLTRDGKDTGVSTVYASSSPDGGRTWTAPRALLSDKERFLCEPGVIRSPDGKRLAMLLRENSRKHGAHVSFSDDEGATWSGPRELPPALTGDRHVPRYLKDGRLIVSMRDMAAGSLTHGDWIAWIGTFEDLERCAPGQARLRLMDNLEGSDCGYAGVEVQPDGTVVATSYGHWLGANEQPYVVCLRLPPSELPCPVSPAAPKP